MSDEQFDDIFLTIFVVLILVATIVGIPGLIGIQAAKATNWALGGLVWSSLSVIVTAAWVNYFFVEPEVKDENDFPDLPAWTENEAA